MKRRRAISERNTTPRTVRMQRPSRYPLMVRLDGKVVPLATGMKQRNASVPSMINVIFHTNQNGFQHTQSECIEIRQRARSVVHHMELTCLQDYVPIGSGPAECFHNAIAEGEDAERIVESKDSPDCACPHISPRPHHSSADVNLALHVVELCPDDSENH